MKFNLIKFTSTQLKGLDCLNCGQPLLKNENFCSYCGQKNSTNKLSFGNFLNNIFSGLFNYDSRFWKTFLPLLTKPGKVSKEYIEGKRARFVNPFQLYLNVSIIFFLIIGISNKFSFEKTNGNDFINAKTTIDSLSQKDKKQLDSVLQNLDNVIVKENPKDSTKTQIITDLSTALALVESDSSSVKTEYIYYIKKDSTKKISLFNRIQDFHHFYNEFPSYTPIQALDSLGYKTSFWNKMYYQQTVNSNKNYEKFKVDGIKSFIKTLTSYISISLFIFLPIFTLFLYLVYIRRKYTYIEHLVFVFHVQTVFFLLLLFFYLLNLVIKTDGFLIVFALLFTIYLYKAMRHFYQQSRLKTILKFILLNGFYMILASIGFIIVAALSFVAG